MTRRPPASAPRAFGLAAALPLLSAAGCGAEPEPQKADQADTSAAPDDTATGPTWYDDVQPLMAKHCTRCHHEGGLGPGDFTDPETVDLLASAMLLAMDEGRMPPAASDPDCRDYASSEVLTLPDDAKQTFRAWIDAGQRRGEPRAPDPAVEVSGELPSPDLVLQMAQPYTPTFSDAENPGNEYRCFVLDPAEAAGRNITAMAPVVGDDSLVHHIVLFSMPRDAARPEWSGPEGFDCIDGGGPSFADGMIAAWAPGMLPIEFPAGAGMPISEDDVIVLQMHYFYGGPESEGRSDQSAYAFELADQVEDLVYMAPLGAHDFVIPAGAPEHRHSDSFTNDYFDFEVLGVFPHMHTLGTEYAARVEHGDGSSSCLVEGAYDFDNQVTYMFREPLTFAQGDRVEYECTWDNSSGTSAVRYGERTDEEMCYFFTLVRL